MGFAENTTQDFTDRESLKNRCKRAPTGQIGTHREALEAWNCFRKYRGMADSAYTRYMQAAPGGITQRRHNVRWQAYSDIADEWENRLDMHLRQMAER